MTLSDVMVTNDTFRYDGHMCQKAGGHKCDICWLHISLSDLVFTNVTF